VIRLLAAFAVSIRIAYAQPVSELVFEVASIKPSPTVAGDAANRLQFSQNGITASGVTLRRVLLEAY
jgi:hypothetical protein